ncbi:MAG: hypothetical protein DWQ36_07475 [Acidobacteria bacterium]|nr:MAG: hypothetical protein DWQ36_07475 [Acidobacteriota bacterium]
MEERRDPKPTAPADEPRKGPCSLARGIGAGVAILIGVHVLMTAIYLGPPNLAKLSLQEVVAAYMEPFFRQRWHLFSPMPAFDSVKLPVRCRSASGEWTPWADPLEDLYRQHYRFRVLGHGKLVQFYHSIGSDLRESVVAAQESCRQSRAEAEGGEMPVETDGESAAQCTGRDVVPLLVSEPSVELAQRYAVRACRANGGDSVVAAQVKLLDFLPKPFSKRHDESAVWGSVMEVPLPPIEVAPAESSTASLGERAAGLLLAEAAP